MERLFKRILHLVLLVIALAHSNHLLFSQYAIQGIPNIRNFTKTSYNAGRQNWAIEQDSKGIMYFANNLGVLEFDGVNWRLIRLSNFSNARSLKISQKGIIYVGGQNELGFLKIDKLGSYHFSSLKHLIPEKYQSFNDVWRVFHFQEKIYFQTSSLLLVYSENKFEVIEFNDWVNFSILQNDQLLFFGNNSGLFALKDSTFVNLDTTNTFIDKEVLSAFPINESDFLINTDDKKQYLLKSGVINEWKPNSNIISDNLIYCGTELDDGRIALGTINSGLLISNPNGNCLLKIDKENGLTNATVLALYEDKSKNLWLALDNGIACIEINSPFSLIDGFPGTPYTTLIQNNKLYVGTNTGAYVSELGTNSQFSKLEIIDRQTWNIQYIDGFVYVCAHHGIFQLTNHEIKKIADNDGYWKIVELPNHPDFVIVGTYHGLKLFKKTKKGLVYQNKIDGFQESARIIELDSNGDIWITHGYKGVYRITLNQRLDSIEEIRYYNKNDGFPSNIFINVFNINDELVFPAEKKIYKYNKWNDNFTVYDELNHLFDTNKHVGYLVEDKLSNIWYEFDGFMGVLHKGANNSYVNEQTLFNQLEDLLIPGFEQILPIDDKNILICTQKGLVHYNSTIQANIESSFPVFIREVREINNTDSLLFGGHTFTAGSGKVRDVLELPFTKNALHFIFSAPYFKDNGNIYYSYQLDGFDAEWSDWNSKNEKEYTNLPEGDYIFKVKAKNIYDKESIIATFQFLIKPPWYRTLLSKAIIFLALILVVYVTVWRILQQKEKQFAIEKDKAEREIVGLKEKNLEAEIARKNSEMAQIKTELTSSLMMVTHKNDIIVHTQQKLRRVSKKVNLAAQKYLEELIQDIGKDIERDKDWGQFKIHFDKVHGDFLERLKNNYPDITSKDIQIAAYLRMNLSSKEIAPLMNITVRSVEGCRHRLRKNIGLDPKINLKEFILKF